MTGEKHEKGNLIFPILYCKLSLGDDYVVSIGDDSTMPSDDGDGFISADISISRCFQHLLRSLP